MILQVIKFGESRSSRTVVSAILRALKMNDLVFFSLKKIQKFIKITIQSLYSPVKPNLHLFIE